MDGVGVGGQHRGAGESAGGRSRGEVRVGKAVRRQSGCHLETDQGGWGGGDSELTARFQGRRLRPGGHFDALGSRGGGAGRAWGWQ